ncbi:hypothetical protein ACFLSQ_07175 [Bacteroidota bacterium]
MLQKEQVSETVQSMPEQFDIDDIVEKLIILDKIQKGLKDSEEGKVFSEKNSEKRLEKWLI